MFNRHQLNMTRFIKLRDPHPMSRLPPPVLVVHGNYSGCLGDLAATEAHALGGPNSVRTA